MVFSLLSSARKALVSFFVISLIFGAVSSVAQAQDATTAIVNDIVIQGNQRVETATIKAFLPIKLGSTYSDSEINGALNELFSSGLFADIKIRRDGQTLFVTVVENPIINEVAFEGNKRIEDEELSNEVQLKVRGVYTKTALQKDVKRILDIYQKSGRFSAVVNPKIIPLDQNRVNLVFEIDEGTKTTIAKISFVGNMHFSDAALRKTIQTKESEWYRFFSSDDTYDPDRLAFDQELLRQLYISNGFADFRVTSATAELTPERDAFFVTFSIDEGDVYSFGPMDVRSEIEQVNVEEMRQLIQSKTGEVFNAKLMEKTIEGLTKQLGDLGYAFVDINPEITRNAETDTIGITYAIKEAPRVYVERINVSGNVRTLDEVVRREFRLAEGDPYNASKIKRSQQRIENLGYFGKVQLDTERGSADDKVNINVDVEEQSTGELTIGAGFSTADGALGDVSIVERNLLGKGQQLKLNFTLAASRQQAELSFTEPYFLGRDLATGFDIFSRKRDGSSSTSTLSYDIDSIGAGLRANYPITEEFSHSIRYTAFSDNITNIDPLASAFIQRQEGKNTTSLIGNTFTYDKLDNRFDPKNGYLGKYTIDVAGIGGNSKFIRNEVRASYYTPTISEDWVLSLSGRGGLVTGLAGEDIRINNRFFIGSDEIRGFNSNGIGPRDISTNDPLGGNVYYAGTVEQGFPLGTSEELGLAASVFTDFGTLYDTDDSGASVRDVDSVRVSAGAGVSWQSPVGPIRIDWAEALVKEDFDETEQIRFSFGTRF